MSKLKGFQKKYLRGLAHSLNPIVIIGQKGLTDMVFSTLDEAFDAHELVKLKFNDFKEKEQKKNIAAAIEQQTGCEMAGMVGHTAVFYRPHRLPEKRIIKLPEKDRQES